MIFEARIVIVIEGREATVTVRGGETIRVDLSSAEGQQLVEEVFAGIRGEDSFERIHTAVSDFVQKRIPTSVGVDRKAKEKE